MSLADFENLRLGQRDCNKLRELAGAEYPEYLMVGGEFQIEVSPHNVAIFIYAGDDLLGYFNPGGAFRWSADRPGSYELRKYNELIAGLKKLIPPTYIWEPTYTGDQVNIDDVEEV